MALTNTLLNDLRAYAQEFVVTGMESGLYNVHVALAALSGRGGVTGGFGRPGVATALGANVGAVFNANIANIETQVPFPDGKMNGFKVRGYRDTTASTTTTIVDHSKKAGFRYSLFEMPILIWKNDLRFNRGGNIRNVTEDQITASMEEMLDRVHQQIWTGNPSDQTAEVWDSQPSLEQACDTNNTYGNVDRTLVPAWAGKTVAAATGVGLSIIDDANIEQGARLNNRYGGVDLVLTGPSIYNQIKQEALSKGGTRNYSDFPPGMEKIGQLYETVMYGSTLIALDDKAPANHVACLNTKTWRFESHPEANLTVQPFADGEEAAGSNPDALTSRITWMARWFTVAPWANVYYTNVS